MLRTVLRWTGYAVAGVLALALLAVGTVYAVTTVRMNETVPVPAERLAVAATPAAIERGRHVAGPIAKCQVCHGMDFGGQVFIDMFPLARIVAPNLTAGRGGVGGARTDAEIELALRHGLRGDGRSLLFMPSEDWQWMSDEDVAALIAYLRQLPPVDRELPPSSIGPLARALYLAGQFPLLSKQHVDPALAHVPAAPPAGPTAEYGRYVANVGGCTGCHGPTLSGGRIPGTPPEFKPASNLTPAGIGTWTEGDFFRALREGVRPGGSAIDSLMPVRFTREMTDDEIRAVYAYLQTVPAKEYGGR